MAEYEIREGSANVFRNSKKTDEKHPDFKSKMFIDGKMKDVAVWLRKTKNGDDYFHIKVNDSRQETEKPKVVEPELNDEIGF